MNLVREQSNKRSAAEAGCSAAPPASKRAAIATALTLRAAATATGLRATALKMVLQRATATAQASPGARDRAATAASRASDRARAATAAARAATDTAQRLVAPGLQRIYSRKRAVQASRRGVTVASAAAMTHKQLSNRLQDEVAIKSMKLVLFRICVLTAAGREFLPHGVDNKNLNVRVFLASFLVTSFPLVVFESIHKLEQDLIERSRAMLAIFDALHTALLHGGTAEAHAAAVRSAIKFPLALHEYLQAFQAWKKPDERKITDRIAHALDALYKAEDILQGEPGGPVLEATRADFRAQQRRLRQKFSQIAGKEALEVPTHCRRSLRPPPPPHPPPSLPLSLAGSCSNTLVDPIHPTLAPDPRPSALHPQPPGLRRAAHCGWEASAPRV